jgi:ABC-2 type transport system permease protein
LPTLIALDDRGPIVDAIVGGMANSTYFDFVGPAKSIADGDKALRNGSANFVVVVPRNFERDVIRGRQPSLLVAADASDPTAVTGAAAALSGIVAAAIQQIMVAPLQKLAGGPAPFSVTVHREYNPEGKTSTNISYRDCSPSFSR